MTEPLGITASTPLLLGGMALPASSGSLRDLTEKLARGDDAAWSQFHRDYGPALFRQLLAETRGDHDLASEALQQTYLRIARHARPCDSAPMFAGWLRVVARTALSDCRRRRQTWWRRIVSSKTDDTHALEPGHENGTHDSVLFTRLDTALAALDVSSRTLLERKYLLRQSVREIAASLSVSEKAVESRLTRARQTLREQLVAALRHHE